MQCSLSNVCVCICVHVLSLKFCLLTHLVRYLLIKLSYEENEISSMKKTMLYKSPPPRHTHTSYIATQILLQVLVSNEKTKQKKNIEAHIYIETTFTLLFNVILGQIVV